MVSNGLESDDDVVISITRGQLQSWTGRDMDAAVAAQIAAALPDPAVTQALCQLAAEFDVNEEGEWQ